MEANKTLDVNPETAIEARSRTERVLQEIYKERDLQTRFWPESLDNSHTPNDWVAHINAYLGVAAKPYTERKPCINAVDIFRRNMIRVAAVAAAAIEAVDRLEENRPDVEL